MFGKMREFNSKKVRKIKCPNCGDVMYVGDNWNRNCYKCKVKMEDTE